MHISNSTRVCTAGFQPTAIAATVVELDYKALCPEAPNVNGMKTLSSAVREHILATRIPSDPGLRERVRGVAHKQSVVASAPDLVHDMPVAISRCEEIPLARARAQCQYRETDVVVPGIVVHGHLYCVVDCRYGSLSSIITADGFFGSKCCGGSDRDIS